MSLLGEKKVKTSNLKDSKRNLLRPASRLNIYRVTSTLVWYKFDNENYHFIESEYNHKLVIVYEIINRDNRNSNIEVSENDKNLKFKKIKDSIKNNNSFDLDSDNKVFNNLKSEKIKDVKTEKLLSKFENPENCQLIKKFIKDYVFKNNNIYENVNSKIIMKKTSKIDFKDDLKKNENLSNGLETQKPFK